MIRIRLSKQEYIHPYKGRKYWKWRVNAVSKKVMKLKKSGRYEIVKNEIRLYD